MVKLRAEIRIEGTRYEVEVLRAALKPEIDRIGIRRAEVKMLDSQREIIIAVETSSLTKARAILDSIIKWSIIVLKTYTAVRQTTGSPFGHIRGEDISSNTEKSEISESAQKESRSNTERACHGG